jgi:DNA helicase-2/ATP-dependent DNA helicase PcrA
VADLNPQQREAVLHEGSPLLILAGAGSGKTRVITVKIAYLINELGMDPASILAVTFTNKAAGEMRERAAALAEPAAACMIRTFHSFGAWLLRRNAHLLDMSSRFTIYDDDDAVTLLRSLYPDYNRRQLAVFSRMISRAKDYNLGPEDDLAPISDDPGFHKMYRQYHRRLREIGNADFGDLIVRCIELLDREPAVRSRLQDRFRVVLVDEYQDSNIAQYELLKRLVGPTTYVCVVGDDDQSIYRFRGAEVRNILTFDQTFARTSVIRLEQNYRSTGEILGVASAVVANNSGRLGKTLFTKRPSGPLPILALLRDGDEEVDYVEALVRDSSDRHTAVLYRTNAQSRLFETRFLQAGIPYRIVGSVRFYEREEVRDVLAVLKFIANHADEVSFRRIVNKPTRGIGAKSLQTVLSHLQPAAGDLARALEYAAESFSAKARRGATEFLSVLRELEQVLESGEGLADFVDRVIRDTGLLDYHREQDEISGSQKIQNLEEMVNAAGLYEAGIEGLIEFLEAVELDAGRETEVAEGEARATLITMHNTKGLEFDRVVITGLEEGLFPRGADESPDDLEEERRLFYVAITRAQNELYMTSVRFRRIHGRILEVSPSRFLREIPGEMLEVSDAYRFGLGAEDEDDFPEGSYVYHDSYGTGVITGRESSGSDILVQVRFESGKVARFIPKYSPLERISLDD